MFLALLLVSNWALVVMYAAPIVRKSTQISPDHRDPAEFWISAELLNIEWKSKCLTTTYCNEPELKVIKTNAVSGEKSSFSWQLNQNFEQLSNRAFVSHWMQGTPQAVEIALEVVGVDPKYRFQRSCDQTPSTKAFASEVQIEDSGTSHPGNVQDRGKRMIVELWGRCFNATLTVQKHVVRCPWCIEVGPTSVASNTSFRPLYGESLKISERTLIVYGCITVLCFISASIGILIIWHVQRRNLVKKAKKPKKVKVVLPTITQTPDWDLLKFNKNNHVSFQLVDQNNGITNVAGSSSASSSVIPDDRIDNTESSTDAAQCSGENTPTESGSSSSDYTAIDGIVPH